MTTINLFGLTTVIVAKLDVNAATTYAVPGGRRERAHGRRQRRRDVHDGRPASRRSTSPLAQEASPVFKVGTGLSPYAHQAPEGALLRPMVKARSAGRRPVLLRAPRGLRGPVSYCLDQVALGPAVGRAHRRARDLRPRRHRRRQRDGARVPERQAGVTRRTGPRRSTACWRRSGPAGSGSVSQWVASGRA